MFCKWGITFKDYLLPPIPYLALGIYEIDINVFFSVDSDLIYLLKR